MQVPDALHVALKDDTSILVLIPHVGSVRAQTLRVPVGDAGDVAAVETGTIVIILFAFVDNSAGVTVSRSESVWSAHPRAERSRTVAYRSSDFPDLGNFLQDSIPLLLHA
jgi:hypothetical protein